MLPRGPNNDRIIYIYMFIVNRAGEMCARTTGQRQVAASVDVQGPVEERLSDAVATRLFVLLCSGTIHYCVTLHL